MMPECQHGKLGGPDPAGWSTCACGLSIPPDAPAPPRALAMLEPPRPLEGPRRVRFPIRWSPELEEKIVTDVTNGASPIAAAGAHGVGKDLFKKWMKSSEEPFASFADAVNAAARRARAQAEIAVRIDSPAKWLAALHRDEVDGERGWNGGAASTVTVQGSVAVQHTIEVAKMTTEELEARRAQLLLEAPEAEDAEFEEQSG